MRWFARLSNVVALAAVLAGVMGADWPQFRGPTSNGAATDAKLPATFNDEQNLLWKVKLPGRGSSSPIVMGDRVFVTSYSGYGEDADSPGKTDELTRHLVCLSLKSGKIDWQKEMVTKSPEADYRGMMTQHGYASNTPSTDGKQVFVFVGTGGVWAFDVDGNKQWQKSVGDATDGWGSGSSVVLTDDLVIVNAAIESDAVVALKKSDGSEAWRFKVKGRSWSTPALVKSPSEKWEVVVSVEGRVSGLDPATGKELWYCDGIQDYTCPSVTAGDGVAYVSGGRRSVIIAVKTGGIGDVTDSHKLWEKVMGGNVTTPALVGDKLFGVSDRGIAYCLDTKTGEAAYQVRLEGGEAVAVEERPAGGPPGGQRPGGGRPEGGRPEGGRRRPGFGGGPGGGFGGGRNRGGGLYASVVAGDDKLFAVTRTSGVYVLAAEPTFKVLAHNTFAGDKARFDATPSIAGGSLFLRSDENLYCIGIK
jgi:outer membrane protein assembly factor BamB